ncbi:hypothetical protein AB9K32_12385 [Allomuricauda sp. XS_ASV26]|jgi:hypothetical protein|uniref:Uncharacterized protein n=1 Tax=Flagellimonas marinaquae TaxID=254955 RepID=A0AA48KR04_9FLAO|nr:hypothetical protein [Allomuricauda ruestringensis]MCA0958393.1 hypothetical protein [Allomuricauda ruestringensis]BDW92661.1 hypothetical protein MACH07_14930 [Allomuricauda aquimarina]
MHIRNINRYKVIKRFSISKTLLDINEILYIQEKDTEHENPQKIFSETKEYLTDISPKLYSSLLQGFIVPDERLPSKPK